MGHSYSQNVCVTTSCKVNSLKQSFDIFWEKQLPEKDIPQFLAACLPLEWTDRPGFLPKLSQAAGPDIDLVKIFGATKRFTKLKGASERFGDPAFFDSLVSIDR